MAKLLGMILLVALAIYALQLAFILLFVAGLIFETEATIGFLAIMALLAGFAAHPIIGGILLVALIIYLFVKNGKEYERLAIEKVGQE